MATSNGIEAAAVADAHTEQQQIVVATKTTRDQITRTGSRRAESALGIPNARIRNRLWAIVITAFSLVLIGTVAVICATVFITPAENGTSAQTILAVFTAVTGFLTGLFVPSPMNTDSNG